MKQVKTLTVVGSGTAGLIAALILKTRTNIKIKIIHSSNEEIIGVGEGSTEHFLDFMLFLGIKPSEIIKECGATLKKGLMFQDWIKDTKYLQSPINPFAHQYGQYFPAYAREISLNSNNLYPISIDKNLVEKESIDIDLYSPVNQYHFDTFKLNEFLKKIAIKNNIEIIDDKIIDIKLDNNGYIDNIIGQNQKYQSDFYIDATGFKRVLMSQLGAKWISSNKYLKLNSAITFPTKDEDNYNYWTLAKAMSAGWRFKIPVWGRHGNGYIYDNNFINAEEAKLEVEKELGHEVEIGKTFTFDPGALENVWIKNCVAIGLSGSFFEPIEASSIGLSIQQSFLLMHRIQNYDDKIIKSYNNSFSAIINNIRDFIVLHYLTKRNDTDFWKNILNTEIPESLKHNLEKWKTKMPISEDFEIYPSTYLLFREPNFILVLAGLGLFDKKSILKEYNALPDNLKKYSENLIKEQLDSDKKTEKINHKELLAIIRNSNKEKNERA